MTQTLRAAGLVDGAFVSIGATARGRPIRHEFTRDSIHAVDFALAVGRPLLVRGETGIGKSQLARAVAHVLGRAFVTRVLDAQFTARELLYEVDTVARLSHAQVLGALGTPRDKAEAELDVMNFIEPGPLWWAYDWASAAALKRARVPAVATACKPENGVVLLLDEIDKADTSVPNGLLDVFGSGGFDMPGGRVPGLSNDARAVAPLVIVATNEERTLPDAFVRRCIVLTLRWPASEDDARSWLRRLATEHFPDLAGSANAAIDTAVRLLLDGRAKTPLGLNKPGLAELVDLLDAVDQDRARALDRLAELEAYVFDKHRQVRG